MRVIGAGLGRTGTLSLKLALERLLGGPCYHMIEVFENPDHIPLWRQAAQGREPDWQDMFRNYRATVDWPAASFWPELSRAFPEAMVLLSWREPEDWWRSASETIFVEHNPVPDTDDWLMMWEALSDTRFTSRLDDKSACIAAYNRHNAAVRKAIAPERLLEWTVQEGWEPICAALGLPVPAVPFPHANTREEFQAGD